MVPDDGAERLDGTCFDDYLWTRELVLDIDLRQHFVVSVLKLPVELFDALIATLCEFVDGCGAHRRFVFKVEWQWDRNVTTFLKDGSVDTSRRRRVHDFDRLEPLFVRTV